MSSLTTLARPYAKAAFELAQGANDLAGWDTLLAQAGEAASVEAMANWLESPHADAGKAVAILVETLGEGVSEQFQGYLAVLAENDRLGLLPEIARLYSRLRQQAEKRLAVRVVSAVALDDEQAKRMQAALAKRFDCEIEMHNEIDPSMLGGAVIYAGDQVIDGSLHGRLARLEGSLA